MVGSIAVPIFPLFGKWRSRFKNYCGDRITWAAWLSFPINDSSLYVLVFVEANASFISVVQVVCFYSGINTLREWVFMSHPRHVLCSASCPSPASFLKESGLSHFRGYDGCIGRNSVWMTNRAALFVRSIQCSSSTLMVIMLSMNPSIDASVAVISTDKGSAVVRWLAGFYFSSYGSKYWCGTHN